MGIASKLLNYLWWQWSMYHVFGIHFSDPWSSGSYKHSKSWIQLQCSDWWTPCTHYWLWHLAWQYDFDVNFFDKCDFYFDYEMILYVGWSMTNLLMIHTVFSLLIFIFTYLILLTLPKTLLVLGKITLRHMSGFILAAKYEQVNIKNVVFGH